MKTAEIRHWAMVCRGLLVEGHVDGAWDCLVPLLAGRVAFAKLDLAGRIVGGAVAEAPLALAALLDRMAQSGAMGAWPFCGSALATAYLPGQLSHAFSEAGRHIHQASRWYVTDILAERVLGEGLRADFDRALSLLEPWREEPDPWLRRALGVAVHLYAKRERERPAQVARLLDLLEPLSEERVPSAVKGVGWGLKTIGRYYPDLLIPWLREQMAARRPCPLMLRKATAYLPDAVKDEFW